MPAVRRSILRRSPWLAYLVAGALGLAVHAALGLVVHAALGPEPG